MYIQVKCTSYLVKVNSVELKHICDVDLLKMVVVREPVAFQSDVPLWCSANVLLLNVWDQLLNYAQ
jgi:hypothetical protein